MHWELMDRYLAGECSAPELAAVERWLSESPKRRHLLEQLAGPGEVEVGEARAKIWARLQDEVAPERQGPPPRP
jgi:anti-sigma factor RsiW